MVVRHGQMQHDLMRCERLLRAQRVGAPLTRRLPEFRRIIPVPRATGVTLPGVTITEHSDLVAALLGVPGVAAAAIDPSGGGPGTLRLQLAPGVDEVGVAGEVNHLLRSRFGLAVDTDRVRVVDDVPSSPDVRRAGVPDEEPQPEVVGRPADAEAAPAEGVTPATPARRIVIDRVQLVSAGLATTVVVSLSVGGRSVQGTSEGTATAGSLNRAVAAATLRAVEAVLDGVARFDVEHVEIPDTGDERTALVVVTMVTDRSTQRLSGASVVREDARQAVIRAVLAAVNRRVGPLLAAEEDRAR